jgi:hypothetical protein
MLFLGYIGITLGAAAIAAGASQRFSAARQGTIYQDAGHANGIGYRFSDAWGSIGGDSRFELETPVPKLHSTVWGHFRR